ncbi:HD domain-containing protein [Actinoplanes subglobosus]|uniref:Metal-dependent phosphohydrolase n=1 Tax=Actinoplanes subglobosus TaxID=1547892 RepID=A0ABV8IXX6_9ACTN
MTSPEAFRSAARGAGATAADADLDAAGQYLLGRWTEPQRHYHDVTHLASVLEVIDRFAHLTPNPDRVRLAAWLHDAVYDPRALGDANERDSAEFAAGLLQSLGAPDEVSAEVARLVSLTAGHATEDDDPDGELLCDADLSILAAEPERYTRYAAAIRREYAHVPDDAFRGGRSRVLTELLNLPSIYRLAPIHEQWEEQARTNLKAELEELA